MKEREDWVALCRRMQASWRVLEGRPCDSEAKDTKVGEDNEEIEKNTSDLQANDTRWGNTKKVCSETLICEGVSKDYVNELSRVQKELRVKGGDECG